MIHGDIGQQRIQYAARSVWVSRSQFDHITNSPSICFVHVCEQQHGFINVVHLVLSRLTQRVVRFSCLYVQPAQRRAFLLEVSTMLKMLVVVSLLLTSGAARAQEAQIDADAQAVLTAATDLVRLLLDRAGLAEIILACVALIWAARWPIVRLTPTRRDDEVVAQIDGALRSVGLQPVPLLQKLLRWFRVGRGAR